MDHNWQDINEEDFQKQVNKIQNFNYKYLQCSQCKSIKIIHKSYINDIRFWYDVFRYKDMADHDRTEWTATIKSCSEVIMKQVME